MSERDTKFLGVARLIIEDLYHLPHFRGDLFQEGVETLIAQRVFDIAYHVATETVLERDIQDFLEDISDFTEWPPTKWI